MGLNEQMTEFNDFTSKQFVHADCSVSKDKIEMTLQASASYPIMKHVIVAMVNQMAKDMDKSTLLVIKELVRELVLEELNDGND